MKTRNRRSLAALFALLLLATGACSDDSDDASTPSGDEATPTVTVDGAWARTSPMMATNGAVYMALTSVGHDDRLVAARVADTVAAVAEVHETVMDPDTEEMAMRETVAIDLPADATITLEPGGYHVMLLDLAEPLEPGTSIEVTLVFAEAGEVEIVAEVRDSTMPGG